MSSNDISAANDVGSQEEIFSSKNQDTKQQKRSYSEMSSDFKSDKIIVSKLKVPTSIGDIYNNSDESIKEKSKVFNDFKFSNMNLFYKENVEELNELISDLKTWENKYMELNSVFQDLEVKLNKELLPEIEIQKNLVTERKRYYDELKEANDSQNLNFDKKLNLMNEAQKLKELEIIKGNQETLASKEKEFADKKLDFEKKLSDEKQLLLSEIEELKKQKQQKLEELASTAELTSAKLQIGYEMNTLKSENLIKLNADAEELGKINAELSKEISNISDNLNKKLIPMGEHLRESINSETSVLNKVIEQRVKKIEESVVIAKQYEQMQIKYNDLQSQLSLYETKIQRTNDSLKYHKEQLQEKEMKRRSLHNELQDLRGNIRVFCRIKPELNPLFIMKEVNKHNPDDSINDEDTLSKFERCQLEVQMPKNIKEQVFSSPRKNSVTGNTSSIFTFDKIFDEKTTNADVFAEVSQLVQSSLDGYKVCIFAYGQTGSGKTYTMLNSEDGIIPATLKHIYSWIDNLKPLGWEYTISIQFVEIYNENLVDLFADKKLDKNKRKKIEIRHADGKTSLTNTVQIDITHSTNAEEILRNAMKSRATAATKENDHSSRSHSIFTITLNGQNKITSKKCEGVLNLIDLAGSERLNKSQAAGDRLKETQAINKSLSCLGDVIHSLSNSKNLKTSHIPFRNSKLTYMLQNYLIGDGKTLMLVNVSPRSYVETVNSLRFSSKVNSTKMR